MTTTNTDGVNDMRKKDLWTEALALGKDEGEGKNARPAFGRAAFLAAADGVILSGKGEDDVFKLFGQYAKGLNKYTYNGLADRSEKSLKTQVSKLRQLVVVGGMPMFSTSRDNGTSKVAAQFIKLVDDRIAALADTSEKAVPVYDKFISVMRAQRAKVKAGTPEPLTQDEIDAAITTKASNPEELKIVRQIYKKLITLSEEKICEGSAEFLLAAAKVLLPRVAILEADSEDEALDEQLDALTPEQKARMLAKLAA